jgi:hypothetical protein
MPLEVLKRDINDKIYGREPARSYYDDSRSYTQLCISPQSPFAKNKYSLDDWTSQFIQDFREVNGKNIEFGLFEETHGRSK